MRDFVRDVIRDCDARRLKSLVAVIVVALSIACLIASRAVAVTAADQIDEKLAATAVDEVLISQTPAADGSGSTAGEEDLLTEESITTVKRISHVTDAALFTEVIASDLEVRRLSTSRPEESVRLLGADSDYLRVSEIRVAPQQAATNWDASNAEGKALIGEQLAERWGISGLGGDQSIRVGATTLTVIGVMASDRDPKLAQTVLIPTSLAASLKDPNTHRSMKLRTALGSSTAVAHLAPELISPGSPQALTTSGSESLSGLRADISTNLDGLLTGVGLILWALTLLVVANSAMSSVLSRTAEIGLRRALGFSRGAIAAKFVVEGGVVGTIGGLCGVGLGAIIAVIISAMLGWTPLIPLWFLAAGPLAGTLTGFLASAYPAVRASGIAPAVAVRSD